MKPERRPATSGRTQSSKSAPAVSRPAYTWSNVKAWPEDSVTCAARRAVSRKACAALRASERATVAACVARAASATRLRLAGGGERRLHAALCAKGRGAVSGSAGGAALRSCFDCGAGPQRCAPHLPPREPAAAGSRWPPPRASCRRRRRRPQRRPLPASRKAARSLRHRRAPSRARPTAAQCACLPLLSNAYVRRAERASENSAANGAGKKRKTDPCRVPVGYLPYRIDADDARMQPSGSTRVDPGPTRVRLGSPPDLAMRGSLRLDSTHAARLDDSRAATMHTQRTPWRTETATP